MTVAIVEGRRGGRQGRRVRVDRQHVGVARPRTRRAPGMLAAVDHPRRSRRARQARAGADPRRQGRADPRQLRRRAARRARAGRARRRHGRELDQPVPHRGPEDRRVRDLRRARRRARRPLHPGRQRGQHHRVLEGLRRVRRATASRRREPRMLGWQAAGSAPLVHGEPVLHPETIATAIRIGNPASWDGAIAARDESGGAIGAVTDAEILDAYRLLARTEGVFVEPASAASVAGLLQGRAPGLVERGETVVCTVTGHGLKDPNRAIARDRTAAGRRRDRRRRAGGARSVTTAALGPAAGSQSRSCRGVHRARPSCSPDDGKERRRAVRDTRCSTPSTTAPRTTAVAHDHHDARAAARSGRAAGDPYAAVPVIADRRDLDPEDRSAARRSTKASGSRSSTKARATGPTRRSPGSGATPCSRATASPTAIRSAISTCSRPATRSSSRCPTPTTCTRSPRP